MFRNQIDQSGNDSFCYSKRLDCLLNMAKASLYYGQDAPVYAELQRQWQNELESGGLESGLADGLTVFQEELHKANEYLQGSATLWLDPGELGHVPAALAVFDELICLEIFLEKVPKALLPKVPETFHRAWQLLALEATVENRLPFHRFIPLNHWRHEVLAAIPEAQRYCFDWYDYWVKVPASTINILVARWADIVTSEDLTWLDLSKEQAGALLEAVNGDPLFRQSLENTARKIMQLGEKAASSLPLVLMSLANIVDIEVPAPPAVWQKGYQATACAALIADLRSDQERYERLLLAAFFGPDLEDGERFDIFKSIDKWLHSGPVTTPHSLSRLLVEWTGTGRFGGGSLAERGAREWAFALGKAASALREPAPYRPGAFQDAVRNLQIMPVTPLVTNVEELYGRLGKLIPGLSLPAEAVASLEKLLDRLFRPQFAFGHADSGAVMCRYILGGTDGDCQVKPLNVELHEKSHVDGLLVFDCVIDFPRNLPPPRVVLCGLIPAEDEVYVAQYCRYEPDNQTFRGEFLVDEQVEGTLRIIFINELEQ